MQKYDIIGDIHGYATTLKALLTKLGYRVEHGAYLHPERMVIFLGDFIDRGPEIRETLQTVRAMVDGGSALAVMGNHEFNALAYHTPDGEGDYLRKHTPEKVEQHRATMEQLGIPYPDEWKGWLEWFSTLPLFLDLGRLRTVHAAWDPEAVKAFGAIKRLDEVTLRAMARGGGALHKFKENLLNGVELELPEGHFFTDKAGFKRKDIRTRWWEPLAGKTYRQAVFPCSETVPDTIIPAEFLSKDLTYGIDQPPVFIGHYWLPADATKRPMAVNVACLDYSVAKGGDLIAYRWDGELDICNGKQVLTDDNFRSKTIFEKMENYREVKEALWAEQQDPKTTPQRREEISDDLWSMCEQKLEMFYDLDELVEYWSDFLFVPRLRVSV